ncbi:hypothetical protein EV580_1291 [Mycobacterium sp. BK086]|uniref:hypothetical protein n=1 Tax=Mycobacterium sp. BK086 TaxID=2512165 RepID=UPI001060418B|nr:hypothetical protein [Mycobacterium sp. BK086]TDO18110.1 hypothetical protein EV580_1291 [Mycobacterium sp. BK086]
MGGLLNPQVLNGIGVVTVIVIVAMILLVSLQRGSLILGVHHREVIAGRDREIAALERENAALRASDEKKDTTIAVLSTSISEKTAIEAVNERILTAIREGRAD